ncbi:peptidase [Hahella sp. CCB-MM4]|uniref:M23 family metallopeptidase n=1 Tax=Hahella sp. (strain CCB-MM4) TaxID=1926491 RepID=UPI000B9A565A|nr:M23 family metallopeptidase [Hahella sp. CCB-MM4]OZG73052.1 peptidase [Hahella sp. CCB-MM4]
MVRLLSVFLGAALGLSVFAQNAWSADEFQDNTLALEGKLVQGGMIIGQAPPGSQVWLDGKSLELTSDGHFVFGFGRDAEADHDLKVIYPDGVQEQKALAIKARDYDIQYIEGISKKIMSPNEDDLKRIREENALVSGARGQFSTLKSFLETFIWPAKGPITGVYGSQRYYNGEPRRPHFGLDIAAPRGAEVVAPASGKVVLVHDNMFFSGGTLIVDHGYGITSTFIHLDKILVEKGQMVNQGDVIALVGATGRATGPHLDWRINWFQTRLDPGLLMAEPQP